MSHDTFNPAEITQAPICECGDECMREPGEGRACRFLVDYGPRSFTPNTDLSAEHEAARRKFRTAHGTATNALVPIRTDRLDQSRLGAVAHGAS